MEIEVFLEDVGVRQKVHLGAALFGVARDLHGRDFDPVDLLQYAVLHHAPAELQRVHLAFAAYGQAQHFGQGVDAAHAHAVQAA